jgi:hypothetical protein
MQYGSCKKPDFKSSFLASHDMRLTFVNCMQTAQYSTQIFSLAVLLSCLFVYNHMGGIDESALDRLSLVTEMTKHVRVKAGQAQEGAWMLHYLTTSNCCTRTFFAWNSGSSRCASRPVCSERMHRALMKPRSKKQVSLSLNVVQLMSCNRLLAGDLDSLSEFAPSFLWLLRDFYLKLEEDGHKVSALIFVST